MAAQLPTLIRGLFFEGWKPAKVPVKMTKQEFLERVLQAVRRYVTEGEREDIRSTLPGELAEILLA